MAVAPSRRPLQGQGTIARGHLPLSPDLAVAHDPRMEVQRGGGTDVGRDCQRDVAGPVSDGSHDGVEPYAWLKSTLEKIAASHPQSRIRELLPWNFDPASS